MANQKTVSPKSELRWVTHQGEGKENQSGKMQYVASVVLDPKNDEEHAAYIANINKFWDENRPKEKKKAKSLAYHLCDPLLDADGKKQYNDDDELIYDPEGKVTVIFKTGTTFPDNSPKIVRIRNAKNLPVSLGAKNIGNGSIGRLSGALAIYLVKEKNGAKRIQHAGVTIYLDAIQLTKFVEYTGADTGFGADEEEGGFSGVEDEDYQGEPEGASAEAKPRI
ncbi:MAG: hypothetical protein HRU18_06840 [Pseudoalteromonas sp.]|uniref:hypothetical protein n=1 Tax=Pseudoalteromonas sp. TaxID=53249 RepID=UPI001D297E6C|nr:hypothetical protein [Pseudoalteromonas sp.]NRA77907.1 hypothetical protein [Pseudoalteromonas sp.]